MESSQKKYLLLININNLFANLPCRLVDLRFAAAAVMGEELNVVTRGADSQDDNTFLDLDARMQLQEIIVRALPSQDVHSLDEYISGEGSLPVCLEMDDMSWETPSSRHLVDNLLLQVKESWMDKVMK